MTQRERTARFRQLHASRPLVLVNAWDAASARMLEHAGAPAIGTTSAGISWSRGHPDGQQLRREEMVEVIRSIVAAVDVPVTADIEGGYGNGSPSDVMESVRQILDAGAVGINLEDSPGVGGEPLLPRELHADRLRAAREAAVAAGHDLVINARTDVFLMEVGPPERRVHTAVRRANLYCGSGADCIFIPGVVTPDTIQVLVREIDGPVNIMAGPRAPSMQQLGLLGVARVSVGSAIAQAVLASIQEIGRELLRSGTYHTLEEALSFAEIDSMFATSSA